MMREIRIALCQINTIVGAFSYNVERILDMLNDKQAKDVDIFVFPELAICGYPPEDLLLRKDFLRMSRKALEDVINESEGRTLVVGFPDIVNDKVYNAAALISMLSMIDVYHKIALPNYGVFDEKRYFVQGDQCLFFRFSNVNIMLTICEDIWIEEPVIMEQIREKRPEIILNISGSPFHAGKLTLRYRVVTDFAKKTDSFICYNNMVGGQDELVFDGGSFVSDNEGKIIAKAGRFKEDLMICDIVLEDKMRLMNERTGRFNEESNLQHVKRDRQIQLHSEGIQADGSKRPPVLHSLSKVEGKAPIITQKMNADLEWIEEIYEALVLGTRDYISKNGFKKGLIGISGGIDSAVTLAIAVDALGHENIFGVTMPSEYTSGETFSDARRVAENFKIPIIGLSIRDIFSEYKRALDGPFKSIDNNIKDGIEMENLQARIRGNILMALSNRFSWIVLTTGNKSELAVGYCTLYGDMAGGFAIIKDCPKTVVYELAGYINKRSGWDIIPRSIFERAPTAELKPDQKDEDSLPPYNILDPILNAYIEEDQSPEEINQGISKDLIKEVMCMVDKSEYKRRQSPPGVKITPKAFGRDRRFPITNRYFLGKGNKVS